MKYLLLLLIVGCSTVPEKLRDYTPPAINVPSATKSIAAAATQATAARRATEGTPFSDMISAVVTSINDALSKSQLADAAVSAMSEQYATVVKQNSDLRDRDIKWQKAYEIKDQESKQQYIDQDIKERNRANWIATMTFAGLNFLGVLALITGAYMLVGTTQKSSGAMICILGGVGIATGLGGMYYGRQYAQLGLLVLFVLVVLFIILLILVARKSLTKTKDTSYALADALMQIQHAGLITDPSKAHSILLQSAASTATVSDVQRTIAEVTPNASSK